MHHSTGRRAAAIACISILGLGAPPLTPRVIEIGASEFALSAPLRLDAGVAQLNLRNLGLLEHHVRLLRLDSARSFREFERALVAHGEAPSWAVDVGGFASLAGGAESSTTIRLSAGVHVLICTARLTDGRSMAMKGMYRSIAVSALPSHTPASNN